MMDKLSVYKAVLTRGLNYMLDETAGTSESPEMTALIDKAEMLADGVVIAGHKGKVGSSPLKSILASIAIDGKGPAKGKELYYSCAKLSLNKELSFPQSMDKIENLVNFKAITEQMKADLRVCGKLETEAYSETVLYELYKYASTIVTPGLEDVSLYDHIKTTAALAICLNEGVPQGDEFLLIGGDVSGIQNYIYTIVSTYASKNLKGRSFYVRLLTDVVVRYMLQQLGLFRANIVYNSGGCFYIIAPNTDDIKDNLEKAIKKIEEEMFASHGTLLFLAIDSVAFSSDVLMRKGGRKLGDVWGDLFRKRDKKKSARLAGFVNDNYAMLFCPKAGSGDCSHDVITGEEISKGEECEFTDVGPLAPLTKLQIDMGKELRNFDCVVVSKKKLGVKSILSRKTSSNKTNKTDEIQPLNLGLYYYMRKSSEIDTSEFRDKDGISVVTYNEKALDGSFVYGMSGNNVTYGFDFYGGNENYENMPTLETLCDNVDGDFERLGVLRMDVDNLGSIFQQGLPEEKATLSRYAALSRSFDYFFSGYLNVLWRGLEVRDAMRSLIIYSGGDDLFIVGNWETAIAIANEIQEKFKEYACSNPAFSISGGVAIVKQKFPIMKAAAMGGEEESRAKKHVCKDADKDSVSFLGMPLNWTKEFPKVSNLKDSLVKLLKEKLPSSFLSKINTHYINAQIENHKITKVKTYWMITYDLQRQQEIIKDKEVKDLIEKCKKEVCTPCGQLNGSQISTDYHPLELWALACRWAELTYRSQRKSKNQ